MITRQLFDRLFPTKGLDPHRFNLVAQRDFLVECLNRFLPQYGITTQPRISAFFANCGVETDFFKTTVEYASGVDYEGRHDLGNTKPGDGRRFKGRGLSQTTGRYNYEAFQDAIGEELGIDVVKNPELLAKVDIAVESACVFWRDHDLNSYADKGQFRELSGIVNRGNKNLMPNHWAKRNELYSRCRRYLPADLTLGESIGNPALPVTLISQPAEAKLPESSGSETSEPIPTDEDASASFLEDAVDKNVSADQLKNASRSAGQKAWAFLIRPLGLIYTALEAGNIAAWLGVVVLIAAIAMLLYWHRADILKLVDKLKGKLRS
jgi:predicted chitinase